MLVCHHQNVIILIQLFGKSPFYLYFSASAGGKGALGPLCHPGFSSFPATRADGREALMIRAPLPSGS